MFIVKIVMVSVSTIYNCLARAAYTLNGLSAVFTLGAEIKRFPNVEDRFSNGGICSRLSKHRDRFPKRVNNANLYTSLPCLPEKCFSFCGTRGKRLTTYDT